MKEPNTEQSLPEIGTLKYHGAPDNPKGYLPINFNGLSLGSRTKPGFGERLLRGLEALTSRASQPPQSSAEPASGDMGVIRYNLPSPIQAYRTQRQRRQALLHAYRRPLVAAACLAVVVPVGYAWMGKIDPAQQTAQALVSESAEQALDLTSSALSPEEQQLAAELIAATPAPSELVAAEESAPEELIVKVQRGESLERIARRHGLTTAELAYHNGLSNVHLLRVGQEIKIPPPDVPEGQTAAALFKVPAVPLVLAPKTENSDSAQLAAATPEAEEGAEARKAPAKPPEPKTYTVKPGDSLSKIASQHGIKTMTLASANDMSLRSTLRVGKVLTVPHADGAYVTLQRGESLSHLALRYGVPIHEIQEANAITNPRTLQAGTTLFLPGAEPLERDMRQFKHASRGVIGDLGRAVGAKFLWPTNGRISSYFGPRDGRPHHGVDIARPKGSPVQAAKGGVVVAAGWNGDYGKCVDIDHGQGIVTRYAHFSKIKVRKGDTVEKGEVIGLVGETGRATGPHLHYEVRIGGRPVNPTKFHN